MVNKKPKSFYPVKSSVFIATSSSSKVKNDFAK